MKMNMYYPPYPSQKFEGSNEPVNPERSLNPKSALATLASGVRMFADKMQYQCDLEIIDLQLGGEYRYYKTIPYGPKKLNCYRFGRPYESIKDKIKEADIHCITSNHTNAAQLVADLARYIKQVRPNTLVIVGGTDATARPSYYLSNSADLVVKGEGEYILARIVQAFTQGLGFESIPNLCSHRNPEDTDICLDQLLDINELEPMSLDLIEDLSIYTDTAEGPAPLGVQPSYICFETSRGCGWSCSFCTAASRGKYRSMTPKTVDKHFKYFKSLGIHTIVWQEDNPLSRIQQTGSGRYIYEKGRDEVLEIFYLAREYGFAWEFANGLEFCKFRPDGPSGKLDRELMEALLWSQRTDDMWRGCYRVQIPLDNMGLEEKKRFPKLFDFDDQVTILAEMLVNYGVIHQTYDLFIGYPEHDQAVINRFTEGCLRIKEKLGHLSEDYNPYFNVFNLALLPGSRDYNRYKQLMQFDIDRDPEVVAIFLSAINTKHFSYYDIYDQRAKMCNLLNDKEMIKVYDGIYTGSIESTNQMLNAGVP